MGAEQVDQLLGWHAARVVGVARQEGVSDARTLRFCRRHAARRVRVMEVHAELAQRGAALAADALDDRSRLGYRRATDGGTAGLDDARLLRRDTGQTIAQQGSVVETDAG